MVYEIRMNGVITSIEKFELKLRAAGTVEGERFRTLETSFKVPSGADGSVKGSVRLIKPVEHQKNGTHIDSMVSMLIQEVEVKRSGISKASQVYLTEMNGDAEYILRAMQFEQEFSIGRVGKRVICPDGWEVEYFQLLPGTESQPTTNHLQQTAAPPCGPRLSCFVLESSNTACWMVTIVKRCEDEKQVDAIMGQTSKFISRLTPELQTITWDSIHSFDV